MIYELTASVSHIQEEGVFDAELLPFERFEEATFFHPEVNYHQLCGALDVIEFAGNLENAAWLDCLSTAPFDILLISKKMVRVLESVGPFKAQLIPTVIYSKKVEHLVYNWATRQRTWHQVRELSLRSDGFVILQLREQLDCLDRDRTLVDGVPFRQSGKEYLHAGEIQHLELRRPADGFPPVFFVPELPFYCFTEEARQACDKAGLKGLWWLPLR